MARWSAQQANAWYERQPWLVGCNFIPSTAINQLEMWQAETFDAETIDRELGWAASIGFNSVRVFLHDLLWEADSEGFGARIDAFLGIAAKHSIATLFVFFDDCWNDGAKLGPQPTPIPGRHNSGWAQSPGHKVVADGSALPRLEAYVTGVIRRFASDERVLMWDMYNEVTNGVAMRPETIHDRPQRIVPHLQLLDRSFEWARAAGAQQPLTAGMYLPDREVNARLASLSDVITFHNYEDEARLAELIGRLRKHERPIICTEYMARSRGCTFAAQLPVFKREHVGCYNWGLVNGKTQTHIAWTGGSDPWFHDVFRGDGAPYDPEEVRVIRSMTSIS